MNAGDLYVRVIGDTKPIEGDLTGLGTNPNVRGAGQKAGDLFAGAVKSSMRVIGPAAGALFAEGINSAAQFQDQLATIDTVAGKGAAALAGLDKGALELSAHTGKPIEDLTSGLYDIVSAGFPAGEAMGILAASTNLALGGLGTTSEAVDAVTSALNAYGLSATDATHVTDVLAKAVQDGKVTTAEIGASIANIAPIAAQAGISLEEVSAGYAQLTAKGVPAAEASTKMRSAIVALISPNEQLNRIQARTGINFAQLAKEQGLSVALQKLREITGGLGDDFSKFSTELEGTGGKTADVAATVKKFQKQLGLTDHQAAEFTQTVGEEGMGQALVDLAKKLGAGDAAFADSLGRVEAYQFALSSTGEAFVPFQAQVEETFNATGIAAEQAAIKMDSPVEAGKRLAAQFKVLLIQAMGPFADSLGPIVIGLNHMGGAMGALIRPATLVGGALGKLATDVLPRLWKGVAGSAAVKAASTAAGSVAATAYLKGLILVDRLSSAISTGWGKVAASGPGKKVIALAGAAAGAIYGGAAFAVNTLTAPLRAAWSKVAGLAVVQAATSGAAAGTAFAAAAAAAIVAAPLVVLTVGINIRSGIEAQGESLKAQAVEFAKTASDEALAQAIAGVKEQFAGMVGSSMGAKGKVAEILNQLIAESNRRAAELPPAIAGGITELKGTVNTAAGGLGKAISDPITGAMGDAVDSVDEGASAILTSIRGLRDDLIAGASGVGSALYDPILKAQEAAETASELAAVKARLRAGKLTADEVAELTHRRAELGKQLLLQNAELLTYGTQAEQISKTKAFLASDFWRQAYEGATPEQKLALDTWRTTLEERLSGMVTSAEGKGGELVDKYTGTITAGEPEVTTAATTLVHGARTPMQVAANDASTYGGNAGQNYADAMRNKAAAVSSAAEHLAAVARNKLRVASPAKEGPLSEGGGPEGWGGRLTSLYAMGMESSLPDIDAAAARVAGRIRDGIVMDAAHPAYEFGASAVTADGVRPGAATVQPSAIGSGPRRETNINVTVEGLLKARDPFELGDRLRRFARDGAFDPPEDYA